MPRPSALRPRPGVRLVAALAAGVFAALSPAYAADAAADDVTSALAAAVDAAVARAETRYAFTIDYWTKVRDRAPVAVRARYDPRRADGAHWTLIDPSPDDAGDLVDAALEQIEKLNESRERADAALVYDGLADMLPAARLENETAAEAVFKARDFSDEMPADAVEATIFFDKAGGYVSRIELKALKPFKPSPMVKIKALNQTQEFAPERAGGPALLRASHNQTEGKAMFHKFTADTRITYSDIEKVDAPPRSSE